MAGNTRVKCPTAEELEQITLKEGYTVLGEGSFGIVARVGDFVVKTVELKNASERALFTRETALWRELMEHAATIPELANYLPRLCWTADQGNSGLIVQHWEPVITLREFIDTGSPIPYLVGKRLFMNLINGLDLINSLGYVHRDIKPTNILIRTGLSNTDPKASIPILIDFGSACKHPCEPEVAGTPLYYPGNWVTGADPFQREMSLEHGKLVTHNETRHAKKLKRQPHALVIHASVKTDRFAMARVLEELAEVIDWGTHKAQKEKTQEIIALYRSYTVSNLAAELGRRTINRRIVNTTRRAIGAKAPRAFLPGALPNV